MTADTKKRILSSLFLVLLIAFSILMGKFFFQLLFFIAGVIIIDEIQTNLIKISRSDTNYIASQFIYLVLILLGKLQMKWGVNLHLFLTLCILLNVILLLFLFGERRFFFQGIRYLTNHHYLIGLMVFLPVYSFFVLASKDFWLEYLIGLILVCAASDVGGWLIGKNFGKRKLWPKVSPNKTIEGAIGGIVISSIVMGLYSFFVWKNYHFTQFILFIFLSACSILGDLIQSKIKRRFSVKDSSSLIPGHGGLYDRFDSHLFVAPIFVFAMEYGII
jgi:phosphatidate cytidylyltransferase